MPLLRPRDEAGMSRAREKVRVRSKRVRDAVNHRADLDRAIRREAERARLADQIREATACGDLAEVDRLWHRLAALGAP